MSNDNEEKKATEANQKVAAAEENPTQEAKNAKGDASTKNDTDNSAEKSKSGKLLTFAMLGVVVLLVGVIGIMGVMLMGKDEPAVAAAEDSSKTEQAKGAVDAKGNPTEQAAMEQSNEPAAKKLTKKNMKDIAPARYYPIRPALVLNFTDKKGKSRFVQIEVEVVSRDEGVIENVQSHLPLIKHELIDLFTTKAFKEIIDVKNRSNLRQEALERVQNSLYKETGNGDVETVLFTNFVVQ